MKLDPAVCFASTRWSGGVATGGVAVAAATGKRKSYIQCFFCCVGVWTEAVTLSHGEGGGAAHPGTATMELQGGLRDGGGTGGAISVSAAARL